MSTVYCSDKTRTLLVLQQLCLTEFKLNIYNKENGYYFDGHKTGAFWSLLIWVEKGAIKITTQNETYVINEGEMYFIPRGKKFTETSVYDAPMKYHILNFAFKPLNDTFFENKFDISKINLSKDKCKKFFEESYANFTSEKDTDNIKAFVDFYTLFYQVVGDFNFNKPQKILPVLSTAIEYINEHLTENFSMEELANYCCISESRLFHIFQKELNISPTNYKNKLRIKKSYSLLTDTNLSIEEISEKLGFNSATHFRKEFRKFSSSSPKNYRKIFNNSLK